MLLQKILTDATVSHLILHLKLVIFRSFLFVFILLVFHLELQNPCLCLISVKSKPTNRLTDLQEIQNYLEMV